MDNNYIKFIIPENIKNIRVDKILSKNFSQYSRTELQDIFKKKDVFFNGCHIQSNTKVNSGNIIFFKKPINKKDIVIPAIDFKLDIIFEDSDIIVLNKPSGMITHPAASINKNEITLVNALLHHTNGNLSQNLEKLRPGVVHRLDKETSGVMIFAKNNKSYLNLTEQFFKNIIKKEYLTIVFKSPSLEGGIIKNFVRKHKNHPNKMIICSDGKLSYTDWSIKERLLDTTLLNCFLHTGRKHQIRLHLSHIGYPVVGDIKYGFNNSKLKLTKTPPRILLHAKKILFKHPSLNKMMQFDINPPKDFNEYLNFLRQNHIIDNKSL